MAGTPAELDGLIQLVVVDDHAILLESLAAALSRYDDLDVVGVAQSVAAFTQLVDGLAGFDVAVVDYDLGDGRGTDIIGAAHRAGAEVLLMSGGHQLTVGAVAARSGCAGFVSKGAPLDDLAEAVRTVHTGGTVYSREVLMAVSTESSSTSSLTDRELEILQLLGAGRSASDISRRLHLSIHTIRSHIRSILQKLGAQSQLEAVVKAADAGLISIGRGSGPDAAT